MKELFLLLLISLFCFTPVWAETQTGVLHGNISDSHNLMPLIGANIFIENTSIGTVSDSEGNFRITNLQPGSYNVSFVYLGYNTVIKSNLIINPGSSTYLKIELDPQFLESDAVEVTASTFETPNEAPVSRRSMDFEEIRRSPGAMLDIQKVMQALPSVISASDQSNEIITRGGNPGENLFVMDEMEIPNPNHFAIIGSGGGPINMINTLLVQKVDFYAGAFSAKYGDRTSSVMDIAIREGSREGFRSKASMAMSGFGLSAEGPFAGGRGSYILAAQKSYMDLIGKSVGIVAVPNYYSFQSKISYDINPSNKLMFNLLYGGDDIEIKDEGEGGYARGAENVKSDGYQVTGGLTLRTIYNPDLYSKTTAYVNESYWYYDVYRTLTGKTYSENDIKGRDWGIKTDFVMQLPAKQELSWGVFAKKHTFDEVTSVEPDTVFEYDRTGSDPDTIIGIRYVNGEIQKNYFNEMNKGGAYFQLAGPLISKFGYTAGLRYEYSNYNNFNAWSPRFGLTYYFAPNTQITAAFGRHYQAPNLFDLTLSDKNKDLRNKYADHYIIGFEKIFGDDIRLTLETYYKHLSDMAVLRYVAENNQFERVDGEMINSGKGYAYGAEFFLQKKLTNNFSTIVSYAYSVARQKNAPDGSYFNSDYDYRNVFTFIGGYKIRYYEKPWFQQIKHTWWYKSFNWILPLADEVEWSVKFRYLGGRPYTPPVYHPEWHKWIVEEGQARNTTRYPAYHRLDLHLDKRFFFDSWNFVLYFDVSNIYNQPNIWEYQYNDDGTRERILQYQTMPVGGFIIEF